MYYNIEDLNRQVIPQTQYLQSLGVSKEGKEGEGSSKKIVYFFPSMIFPKHMELLSITILSKKNTEDRVINFAITKEGTDKAITLPEHSLTHKANKLTSTLNFKTPLILDPLQPFFFHTDEIMVDSCLVLGFRNFTGKFGPKEKKLIP
ncbi:hypothetical protein WIV_gp021 [Wiseana iridescent virus]|uniref:Uncharacterized protein n=1 Tax=Wiseana iridescent virus TaxID=68347 RepID=G0T547_IRV9|nr:hypothetical protein WIV_gp021 [Wiseana iridescent virus]ADO00364.1 hypothetical protein [Wiseana iridescent virus]